MIAAICGLFFLVRPDEDPLWPDGWTWLRMGIALVVLFGYAMTLKPLGFIIPTAIASCLLSYQIQSRVRSAVMTGVGLSLGLFVIFKFVLDLSLFAFPRSWGIGI